MGRGSLLGHFLRRISCGSLGTEIDILGQDMTGKVSEVGCGKLLNCGYLRVLVQIENKIGISSL